MNLVAHREALNDASGHGVKAVSRPTATACGRPSRQAFSQLSLQISPPGQGLSGGALSPPPRFVGGAFLEEAKFPAAL